MDDNTSQNLQDLAAALNGHQITDDEGAISEETTSVENTASQETNTVDETATAEKSAEATESATKSDEGTSENELAEDETGKRYVPEARFKEVYGKLKAKERELANNATQSNPLKDFLPNLPQTNQTAQPVDTTSALELELLKTTLPQFNPESEDYSAELDELGATIYKAAGSTNAKGEFTPSITKLEAARKAIAQARKFTQNQLAIAAEARKVKAIQSDQGITSRSVGKSGAQAPDPDKMTLEEKEAWLKANGQW